MQFHHDTDSFRCSGPIPPEGARIGACANGRGRYAALASGMYLAISFSNVARSHHTHENPYASREPAAHLVMGRSAAICGASCRASRTLPWWSYSTCERTNHFAGKPLPHG